MAFFTNFGVRGDVGLLDWYTVSVGVVSLVMLTAHAAAYLTLKTEGPVHDRCVIAMRWLWAVVPVLFIGITIETGIVRPEFAGQLLARPLAWVTLLIPIAGAVALFTGIRQGLELRTFIGSNLIIAGFLITGASVIFPVFLYSTLTPDNSLTAYNSASSMTSLELAMIWWPVAFVLTVVYWWFVAKNYLGKVKLFRDVEGID
jgi:cytochrome d ubiquinol oxidase subunit II